MLPERWSEIKGKLHEALQLEPAVRATYLAQMGATDPDLQKELESLIASHERTGTDFLSEPLAEVTSSLASQVKPDALLGRRVGSYQIMGQIGAGGMGEVYRAFRADDQYKKQVAIKLVRAGQNSDFVVNRFKNERQILASLDHPNIARLLDGGTTENGVPYFVMELIEGLPIDEYCDTRKLPITERLKLFVQVCSAVQYAHQHLFIHRDIKPSNILVTYDSVPKLLDFGIAKILEGGADVVQLEPTLTFFRVLTPEYASPEQVKGATITTSSDIYSLGVVLYVLLTGRSPYQLTKPTSEIARAVCEVEPEKPSAVVRRTMADGKEAARIALADLAALREGPVEKLSKRLRGDLDDIVLMALRKEPERRYASVEQFAQDIQRHLDSLPVLARKDFFSYRASKFVNRHRFGVISASVAAIGLLTALLVTLRANRIARDERTRAEHRFNDVRKLANSMIFDLPGPIRAIPGSATVEKMLYDNGLKYLDSLAEEAKGDSSLQRELAAAYKRLGDSQGFPYGGSLGDYPGALASYRKSLQMRQRLVDSDRHNLSDQIDLSNTYRTIGALQCKMGDTRAGRGSVHTALEIARPLAEANPDNVNAQRELGNVLFTIGNVDVESLQNVALQYHFEALKVFQKLEGKLVPQLWQRQISFLDGVVASDYLASGNYKEATRYAREALQMLSRVEVSDASVTAQLKGDKASRHSQLGYALLFGGQWKEAKSEFRSELSLFQEMYDPKVPDSRASVALGFLDLGHAESLAGNAADGMRLIKKGMDTLGPHDATDPTDADTTQLFVRGFLYEGEALEQVGDESKALRSYEEAVATFESSDSANKPVLKPFRCFAHAKVAGALARLGRRDQARETYGKALALIGSQPASEQPTEIQYALLNVYAGMGDLVSDPASHGGTPVGGSACDWYRRSMDIWRQLPARSSVSPNGFRVIGINTLSTKLAKCQPMLRSQPPISGLDELRGKHPGVRCSFGAARGPQPTRFASAVHTSGYLFRFGRRSRVSGRQNQRSNQPALPQDRS
jgi:eukaryotic-like serine/threonine-protein kinase